METVILTLLVQIKMFAPSDDPTLLEYCFGAQDNLMHRKIDKFVWVCCNFVLSDEDKTLEVQFKAFSKVKDDHNQIKVIESYLDEAMDFNHVPAYFLNRCSFTDSEYQYFKDNMAVHLPVYDLLDEISQMYREEFSDQARTYRFRDLGHIVSTSMYFSEAEYYCKNEHDALLKIKETRN